MNNNFLSFHLILITLKDYTNLKSKIYIYQISNLKDSKEVTWFHNSNAANCDLIPTEILN